MNDIDLDTILAIADGQLTGQAKQDALDRIAADPKLGSELASQISAMDELRALEPALMTASERTALRTALVEQLNLQPAAPVVDIAKRPRPWWQPVLGLASAAALLIAIVAVPSIFSGSDDSAGDFVAIAPEATSSSDATAELDTEGTNGAATTNAASGATTSTVLVPQVAEENVQEFFSLPPDSVDTTVTVDGEDSAAAATEDQADEAIPEADSQSITSPAGAGMIAVDSAQLEDCLTTLAADLPVGVHTPHAVTLDAEGTVVHLGVETGDGVIYSVSIDLETCEIATQTP